MRLKMCACFYVTIVLKVTPAIIYEYNSDFYDYEFEFVCTSRKVSK